MTLVEEKYTDKLDNLLKDWLSWGNGIDKPYLKPGKLMATDQALRCLKDLSPLAYKALIIRVENDEQVLGNDCKHALYFGRGFLIGALLEYI